MLQQHLCFHVFFLLEQWGQRKLPRSKKWGFSDGNMKQIVKWKREDRFWETKFMAPKIEVVKLWYNLYIIVYFR